ncbi:MAG: ABC transporter ATP-binding protein [Candidatus Omnitrophica bacterium]|nr:ABC transporter ATP-binding protein [Candidatus Omnitrophota bacterium]
MQLNKLKAILIPSEKRQLLILGLGTVVLSLLETFSIAIIFPLMSLFISPQKIYSTPSLNWLYRLSGSPDVFLFVVMLIGATFIIFVLKSAYSIAMLYQQQKAMGHIASRLTFRVLYSYLNKPYSFHLMNNSSELFKNVSSEAMNCIYYLSGPMILIGSEAIIMLGICIFLVFAYPVLMLIVFLVFGAIVLLINTSFKKRIRAYASERERSNTETIKNALESLGGIKEIQTYGVQDYFSSRYFDSMKKYADSFVKFNTLSGLPRYIFEVALVAFALSVALFGVYAHKSFIEFIPSMVVLGVAMLRLLPSFWRIYGNVGYLHYGKNSLDIVYEILKEGEGIKGRKDLAGTLVADPTAKDQSIRLEDVTFCYKTAARPMFEGLTIAFPLHRISAIAGETGSGKSTAIDMVTGLLTPQKGRLSYCGLSISGNNIAQYRARIGYVPQHIFLVDDSIASNIAFGLPANEIDRKRVEYALRIAQLGSFVGSLPDGIDAMVGERGVRISGGQRQRIGIARAIYRDPAILILDEASSALDSRTESELYAALKGLKEKMTIILVTHRLATLEHADLIYVLEHGRIVDSGDYDSLSARSQIFQKIASQKVLSQESE